MLAQAAASIRLPSPAEMVRRALDLDKALAGDPVRAREALRRLFRDGRIVLRPQPEAVYLAEGDFLPLVVLAETAKPPAEGRGLASGTPVGCAGRI